MLEGILVIAHVIIVVVGVSKEAVARSKHVTGGDIRRRQLSFLGFFNGKEVFVIIGQILAQLVSQVGIGIAVTHNLNRFIGTYAAMIGSYHYLAVGLRQHLKQISNDRMAEPAQGDGAIGTLVISQFAHHLRFSSSMRQHINEIEYHHIQVILLYLLQLLHKLVCIRGIVYLIIGEGIFPSIAF